MLDLLRTVGQARDPDEFVQATLEGVIELVPCAVATLNEVVPQADRVGVWTEPTTFHIPPGAAELLARLAGEHPLIRHYATTGDGSALRISDFWTTEEFHASRLYELIYRRMGIEYQMSVSFSVPRPSVLGLVVNRDGSDRDFSERDRSVLNVARPHLVQHWRNAQDQQRLRGLLDAASDVMTERDAGVVVLWDPPEEVTPGALVTLYRYFGRPSRTSPLPVRVARWVDSQRESVGRLSLARPLSAQLDGRRMVLRYLPAQRSHPGAIVLSEDRRQSSRRSVESLGLTRREAEVVRLVMAGATNAAIAVELHVSPGTVKKHLDNVYDKLGVRGRGALTAFILDLAPVDR